ncbi:MAG: helix-turn-helix domain-containing protein [Anaerolineales bacterium]|nr:helix-turn-helix domain-containing protein [Anaerolineales bacterium]MCB8952773.1 helix-turn-helix domain-containing protein [Ardenticatenales bacterium]
MNDNDYDDNVMTVKEVSSYLKLAESTVYRLAQDGRLPGRKFGGTWRFSRKALDKWFQQTTSTEVQGSV